jgi:hypothetical protein
MCAGISKAFRIGCGELVSPALAFAYFDNIYTERKEHDSMGKSAMKCLIAGTAGLRVFHGTGVANPVCHRGLLERVVMIRSGGPDIGIVVSPEKRSRLQRRDVKRGNRGKRKIAKRLNNRAMWKGRRREWCAWASAVVIGAGSGLQAQTNAPVAASGSAAPPAADTTGSKANVGFWSRLGAAYLEQMGSAAYTPPAAPVPGAPAPAPTRRGHEAPFDAPPYPDGEWQLGGTPIIGDKNELPTGPLMQAIYDGPNGKWWKESGLNFYGWEDFSGNLSTSHNVSPKGTVPGPNANFPLVYDLRPNRLEENQFAVFFEKTPDEFQTDHVDWGFRLMSVYGLDYRYMISRGFLDSQLLKHNNYAGFDSPMLYANIYVPYVAQGMNICVGRIISEADIEAQLAPNNLMSSHSLLYGFDPYTQWGVFTTTKLSDRWTVQAGIAAGNDVAPWQSDQGREATGTVMIQWQSANGKDSFYGGANAFNNGRFGYNNIQQYVGTFTHKFNEKWWTSHETWYMYEHHATVGPTPQVPFQNAFYPVKPGYAPEWATLNYVMYRTGPSTFLTLRNECFDDIVGQRTGINTIYTEHALGLTWWPNKVLTVRPEIRFDHSYAKKAYDNSTRHSQATAQFDVVWHF